MLEAHEIVRHFTEVIITPERAELPESAEFRHAKERFKADERYKCRVWSNRKSPSSSFRG